MRSALFSAAITVCLPLAALAQDENLPVVDLGYQQYRALRFEESSNTYNFTNIRFGQPPIGDLRFREPVPAWESPKNTTINDGSVFNICPSVNPAWLTISNDFFASQAGGTPFNETAIADSIYGNETFFEEYMKASEDPRTNEDCLFLDVVVPKEIYSKVDQAYGAPVLLWIYGGGYTVGNKNGNGFNNFDPSGLLAASMNATGQRFIYVAINYRLGALGWLAGPTLASDGTANAGLYDQRLALDWVEKYIHLFGGDKSRVTIMGESAGGGSVMHQITAFNGKRGTKFAQAIPQSPGWYPISRSYDQEETFDQLLQIANVTSLDALRNLSTDALQLANFKQVFNSPYGSFTYGPVVDGIFAPQQPGRALLSGQFDPKLRVMSGHNADEGLLFTSPNLTTNAAYDAYIDSYFAELSSSQLDEVINTLYPPVYNGSYGYTNGLERAAVTVGESIFTCNTNYLARAFGVNRTHNYQFSVPPALHGQDVQYTFAADPSSAPVPAVATALQTYITTFVVNGAPSNASLPGVPAFPVYGSNATVLNLNATELSYIKDSNASPRCLFWQKAL